MWLAILLSLLLVVLVTFLYGWYDRHYNFWRKRNIPHIPSDSIFGNIKDIILYRKCPAKVLQHLYLDPKTKNEPVVGFNICHQPALLIKDADVIKRILIKDFNYFSNRHASSDPHSDQLGSSNLFFVNNPMWKEIRKHISPIFTSGKMKYFFHLVNTIGENLDNYLRTRPLNASTNSTSVDVKEICALYTTDVIASVAYGVEANSIKNPESEFRRNGRHIFNFTPWRAFEFTTFFFLPQLVSIFKSKVFSAESTKFLRSAFNYIINEREKSKESRNDLIDILLEMRDKTRLQINGKEVRFDGDILVSQAAIFFTAGYETTSTTMSFALYELCKHPTIQETLRKEIKEVLEMNKGGITYDIILNMKYLHMVVEETLRLYPPVPFLDRKCNLPKGQSEGYSLKPICDFSIPDGTAVLMPTFAFHRDEKYFPNPEQFIPERFAAENRGNINPYIYMPFGIGNRMCVGDRFGLMQTKIGLFYFLKNHFVQMNETTPKIMKLEEKAVILQSEGGIFCDIVRDPLMV